MSLGPLLCTVNCQDKGKTCQMFPVCAVVAQSSIFAFHQSADVSCSVRSVGLRQPSYRLDLLNLIEKKDGRDLSHRQEGRSGVFQSTLPMPWLTPSGPLKIEMPLWMSNVLGMNVWSI